MQAYTGGGGGEREREGGGGERERERGGGGGNSLIVSYPDPNVRNDDRMSAGPIKIESLRDVR